VIADEAQAIKNSDSLSHRACCLIKGKHRLAMTGTPVENSADDLLSILDFVSPGLLGRGTRARLSRAATHGKLDAAALEEMSKALKPFILRRTKAQVLKELPLKTEKVLHCELSPPERKSYEELRDYYREHLRGEIEKRGLAKSKIIVLEALLRLRQAACHPGLIDKKFKDLESAKVETLIAQLEALASEGHKALVFSQFTSFLDIVGAALAKKKIDFERLDGKTPQEARRERVARFQQPDTAKVFLISLKAGGVGLNLTAASYVFILDPWWNPAVESQAIDRSHRIGQKNKVIAYRLIAKGTVEEKIIELQHSKRELADALITADASLLKKMSAQDIELLLS
jgi:SNF2 family DNA or RNA helicase